MNAAMSENLRREAIREWLAVRMAGGMDGDSLMTGIHLALANPTLGRWIAEAVDKDRDTAAFLRSIVDQDVQRLYDQVKDL
jgi:hypothetical protein